MNMTDEELAEIRTTMGEAALVSAPGYPLSTSQRETLETALDRIPRKAYVWLWKCVGEIDRLTAELAATRQQMADKEAAGYVVVELWEKRADALREENAKLKRWFADESAHAQEAVKEIAKLREALTKIENVLMLGGEIPCVCPEADARQIASDALASHTEPPTQEVEKP